MLRFLRAMEENNLELHIATLEQMTSIFFAFDHPNYARYTAVYQLMLMNIEESHPGAKQLLSSNSFSVNRSSVSGSRSAVDITIEQTINRHAKSQGGIIGFSRNHSAHHRWCNTRHTRASFLQATREMVGMANSECTTLKELRSSQILNTEEEVSSVISAFTNFVNPFAVEDPDLFYCIASGAPATDDIAHELLSADEVGVKLQTDFVQERLVKQEIAFHSPIKKQNLKTFPVW